MTENGGLAQRVAATRDIVRNLAETASATETMTVRTSEVSTEANETGQLAATVQNAAVELDAAMEELRHSVIRVVRTATSEVDRRVNKRYVANLRCRLTLNGQSHTAQVVDLSSGGAQLHEAPATQPGARGALQIDGIATPLPFVVRQCERDTIRVVFEPDAQAASELRVFLDRLTLSRAA